MGELVGTCPKASCKLAANDSSEIRGIRVMDRIPDPLISETPNQPLLQNLSVPLSLIGNDIAFKTRGKQNALFVVLGGYSSLGSRVVRILPLFDHLIASGPLQSASHVQPSLLLAETRQRQMACKENALFEQQQ